MVESRVETMVIKNENSSQPQPPTTTQKMATLLNLAECTPKIRTEKHHENPETLQYLSTTLTHPTADGAEMVDLGDLGNSHFRSKIMPHRLSILQKMCINIPLPPFSGLAPEDLAAERMIILGSASLSQPLLSNPRRFPSYRGWVHDPNWYDNPASIPFDITDHREISLQINAKLVLKANLMKAVHAYVLGTYQVDT